MQLTTEQIGLITVVKLEGRLDAVVSDDLHDSLITLLHQGKKLIVVNCYEVSFLSSSGMRTFLTVAQLIQKLDGKICFCGFSHVIQEVLQLSGISKYFNHCTTLQEATLILHSPKDLK